MSKISPFSLVRNAPGADACPSIDELRGEVAEAFRQALRLVEDRAGSSQKRSFRELERELRDHVMAIGRALVVLFLHLHDEHVVSMSEGRLEGSERRFRRAPPIARNLATLFGVVRDWRTYMREVGDRPRHGFHVLDRWLGFTADRFSWNVLSQAARLATELSYASARSVLLEFVPNAPSTEVIEQTMLGLGAHAEDWFEQQPPPDDDGEVLVIEIDGKAAPTATERELKRRRRKRKRTTTPTSQRHRGREKRSRYPKDRRRKKGDKAKNGRVATMVVMYTLRRRGSRRLEGPISRRHYASFGPKEHAFRVARREADKRGFTHDSGRFVQVVTDGDKDYAELVSEYFPEAEHTIDYFHVMERLWEAGGCFLKEGSNELEAWVEEQRSRLFEDDVDAVLDELRERYARIAKTGPGNKSRRERLNKAREYLEKRAEKISYGYLRRRDLVLSTGIVEGAVKNIIGRRCDHGGMRWIKERAQAVLQLRCIQANGDWESFERYVHDRLRATTPSDRHIARIQRSIPAPLPEAA